MNYGKVLDAALQLLPKKINVTVINEITGMHLGKYKMAPSQLPATFDKPTILKIAGHTWRIVKAHPAKADDFSFTRKLTLVVLEEHQWTDERLQFNVPTKHAHKPVFTNEPPDLTSFVLDLEEGAWRQLEFLPIANLGHIQDEMALIEPALVRDNLWGYASVYTREQTANLCLDIPLDKFCHLVKALDTGVVRMRGSAFVQNAIAIKTINTTYYGMVLDDNIRSLCVPAFECIDDEFVAVVTTYNLVLADWCTARVLMI